MRKQGKQKILTNNLLCVKRFLASLKTYLLKLTSLMRNRLTAINQLNPKS